MEQALFAQQALALGDVARDVACRAAVAQERARGVVARASAHRDQHGAMGGVALGDGVLERLPARPRLPISIPRGAQVARRCPMDVHGTTPDFGVRQPPDVIDHARRDPGQHTVRIGFPQPVGAGPARRRDARLVQPPTLLAQPRVEHGARSASAARQDKSAVRRFVSMTKTVPIGCPSTRRGTPA